MYPPTKSKKKTRNDLFNGKIFVKYVSPTKSKTRSEMTNVMVLTRCFFFFSFSDFLSKSICCGYSFELLRLVTSRCNSYGYPQHMPL